MSRSVSCSCHLAARPLRHMRTACWGWWKRRALHQSAPQQIKHQSKRRTINSRRIGVCLGGGPDSACLSASCRLIQNQRSYRKSPQPLSTQAAETCHSVRMWQGGNQYAVWTRQPRPTLKCLELKTKYVNTTFSQNCQRLTVNWRDENKEVIAVLQSGSPAGRLLQISLQERDAFYIKAGGN